MRSVVFSLLVPTVLATCLDGGIPRSQRRDVVNADGETYPLGFMIGAWAASYASNTLGAQITEEVLGYNVYLNYDNLAYGTTQSYYALAGCKTFNDNNDRGCAQGATRHHVQFEAWMGGYAQDWESIQNTYRTMAPKDLGTMGYNGFSTAYFPKSIQQQAYSTTGTALQFYRDWNTSWKQPWTHFPSISSFDTSLLKPCTDTVMNQDAAMKRHLDFTGDRDGLVITNDQHAAKCFNSWWWAAPSCPADTSRCVAYMSGGAGWGVEEVMQKFTLFNMPVAIAVAVSYTDAGSSGGSIFYWWKPDPTFLDLEPMVLKFPPFKPHEWLAGIMTTEAAAAVVSTISSRDLEILAPIVERFADNVDLPMSEMDHILLDHKDRGLDNSEASWRNVTCKWLRDNEALWRTWIPDESECSPGFGLYDSVLQEFTDDRNVSNKIVCQACEPGFHSKKITDGLRGTGATYICIPCGVGTSQDSGASLSCKPCKEGEYEDLPAQRECRRCDTGTYQDETGQIGCKACPSNTSTLGVGQVAPSDCGCAKDSIDMDRTGAFNCVKCSEGMFCPALSQLVDLERGMSDLGESFLPRILEGYYTTVDAPTEVYQCGSLAACPGGTPGSCSGGLIQTPCSACSEGETWTGTSCEDCSGWRTAVWYLAFVMLFVGLTMMFYATTVKATAKATVLFATTASVGMLVMSMQNMGLIGMMTVEWPITLNGIFSFCQFLLLDIDSYGFSCIAGSREPIRYLLSALIFPVGILWLTMGWLVSKLLPQKYHWNGAQVASCMGAFLQLSFSTMSATSLAPMMCYKHPNGLRSILKYPGVLCGSADHDLMLVIGWILLCVFVLGFVALCAYSAWMVPTWSAQRKDHFVGAIRFLVARFRLDSWWFGVPLLVRGPLINLPVVLATDFPPIQVVCIAIVLTTMMVLQMLSWPWKVPMLNVTDCIISFCIVLLVTTSSLYLNEIDSTMYQFASIVTTSMLSGIGISIMIMVGMTVIALFHRVGMGGGKELKCFNLGGVPATEELAKKVKAIVTELEAIEFDELKDKLEGLSVFDMNAVTTCITLMATEVAPPAEDGHTYKFNKRIGSSSFDPALKRKPQSRRDTSLQKSKDTTEVQETTEVAEVNEVSEVNKVKKTSVTQSTWI